MSSSGQHVRDGAQVDVALTRSVAIVLPAYNESATVVGTIRAFHEALPGAMIVVVDNASSDDTAMLVMTALSEPGIDGLLLREPRRGKGHAVRRAFHAVAADVYLLADADQTYPADRATDMIAPVLEGAADMVVGDRLAAGRYARENRRRFHGAGNNLVRVLVNRVFHTSLGDIMSGYRAMSRDFVANYPIMVGGFEIEVDMTLHALDKRFRIIEIPIEYRDRPEGSFSKLNTVGDGRRVLSAIIQLVRHYRPLLFFGALSVLFAVLGIVAAIPVIIDWIEFRYIYHVPLAILATGLEIVAVMTAAVGLILDSVAHLDRMAYERHLLANRGRQSSPRNDVVRLARDVASDPGPSQPRDRAPG